MTRYTFSVWYKGSKPIYKPPRPAKIISETVSENDYMSGMSRLTIVHEMERLPDDCLYDPHEVVELPTGEGAHCVQMELYTDEPPPYITVDGKPKKPSWWQQFRSRNLRREF